MREDRVLPRRAGRTPRVGKAGRVLVQRHGQVQILLRGEERIGGTQTFPWQCALRCLRTR